MRILLDECCPRPLLNIISGHEVYTVEMAGFKGLENGDLLRVAEEKFDLFITVDKNLRYQQNLSNRKIAIIELPINSWARLKPMAASINAAIQSIKPSDYLEIPNPLMNP